MIASAIGSSLIAFRVPSGRERRPADIRSTTSRAARSYSPVRPVKRFNQVSPRRHVPVGRRHFIVFKFLGLGVLCRALLSVNFLHPFLFGRDRFALLLTLEVVAPPAPAAPRPARPLFPRIVGPFGGRVTVRRPLRSR